MKITTLSLSFAAASALAASAPLPKPDVAAAQQSVIARSLKDCAEPRDATWQARLTKIFSTQKPAAIVKMQKRGVTVCLDKRLAPLRQQGSNKSVLDYLQHGSTVSLPYAGDYSLRPKLFNTVVDNSRTTVFEWVGNIWDNAGGPRPRFMDQEGYRFGTAVRLKEGGPAAEQEYVARRIFGL